MTILERHARRLLLWQMAEFGGSMAFEAKALLPLPGDGDTVNDAFEDAASGSVTLLVAPSGYMLTECLASAFTRLDRQPVWLRLGPEDRDPATFLLSLADQSLCNNP